MDCLDLDAKTVIGFLALFWWLASGLAKLLKKANQKGADSSAPPPSEEPWSEEAWEDEEADWIPAEAPVEAEAAAPSDALATFRAEWLDRSDRLGARADEMAARFVHDRPNRVFVEMLRGYVPEQLRQAQSELKDPAQATVEIGAGRVQETEYLLEVVAYLAAQRHDERLRPMLADADRLAEACYRPVLTFAKSQGIDITSNRPVSVFTEFDLSIWTGLIPTSVAPMFLPPSMFSRASWWPAVPHEVGHDFFASIGGFSAGLRDDLGLPSEEEGRRIIRASGGSVDAAEIQRVFGAWLEELFCDVFAVLMTGPAYVASMLDLFASPHDPRLITTVDLTRGGYDIHPPRHLRFLVASDILAKLGFKADLAELREEWETVHGADNLREILMPTDVGYVGFPIEPFEKIATDLAECLYRGPLEALRGRGLSGISGLDYGPHRHNEAKRARATLLRGQVPEVRDPRAVIAGAALAAHAQPESEEQILRLALEAIRGIGEPFADPGQARAPAAAFGGLGPVDARAVVQALVVGEIMRRPGARP